VNARLGVTAAKLSYCFGAALGVGGARRSASEITAIERAPFFPTDRTAK